MNTVVLLLGANLGNEIELFAQVRELLNINVGECTQQSSIYVSPPWGFSHENNFYNQVVIIHTSLNSDKILNSCLQIEQILGRIRNHKKKYEARIIDIDILYYNNEIIQQENLVIPHQLLHKRKFALLPLCELLPDYIHPFLKKTNKELLVTCEDDSSVVISP